MTKKPTTPVRDLATIAHDLNKTYRTETEAIVNRGRCLIEAKAQVDHGQWEKWLADYFPERDARTAQRYMKAARWAAKNDTSVVFNLEVQVLYDLSDGDYGQKTVTAVLKAAETEWIDFGRLLEIDEEKYPYVPPPPSEAVIPPRLLQEEQVQAEAEAALAGPPPELPEPEKPDPDRYLCEQLQATVMALKTLSTKRIERFANSAVTGNDLRTVCEFLDALAVRKLSLAGNAVDVDESTEKTKKKFAELEA
jgi:hypothetical protein